MEVKEIAQKVLERLGPNGENWTQGDFARDAQGCGVPEKSPKAICWCVMGAASLLAPFETLKGFGDAFAEKANYRDTEDCVGDFNDNHTFPEVKAVLEELAK